MTSAAAKSRAKLLTAGDLLPLYSEGVRGELIRGVLHQTVAAGIEHGEIAMNFGSMMRSFVGPARLGRVVGSDSGIRLDRNPDTVREPDVAFISAEKMPRDMRVRGCSEVVPDLVVEIISPNDRPVAVYDKAQMWLRYGVLVVLVIDPDTRSVTVLPQDGPARTLAENDTLDGGEVLPGFTCPVRDIFDL